MPEPDPIAELLADRLHNALDWLGPDTNQAVTAVLNELENT